MFFHAVTLGRVFKHSPRGPATVNTMKQTCVIVILAYLLDFNLNHTENDSVVECLTLDREAAVKSLIGVTGLCP